MWVKRIKGIALFFTSMAVATSLILSDTVVADFIPNIGITIVTLSLYFFVSGILNLIIGLANYKWNAIWFVPFFLYSGLMWLWYISRGYKASSLQAPAMFTLLTIYLVLELVEQYRESNSASNGRIDASRGRIGSSGWDGVGGTGDIPVSSKPDKI